MKLFVSIFLLSVTILSNDYFIDKRTNIIIYFSINKNTFPKSWKTKKINAKGVSLSKKEYQITKRTIKKALAKYPLSVIKNNLKAIYVLKKIEFYGQQYGGTNSTDTVYLTNNGIARNYSEHYIEQTFHHEFSSILLRNYPHYFDKEKWINTNIKGFKYGKGGVNALKKKIANQKFNRRINKKGLLTQYSISSLENDFNNFAQNIFLPSKNFKSILRKYKRLRQKRDIILRFYQRIDNQFTKQFFNEILYKKHKKYKKRKNKVSNNRKINKNGELIITFWYYCFDKKVFAGGKRNDR